MPDTSMLQNAAQETDQVVQASSGAKRVVYIDIMRIVACLCVLFNHTGERGFCRFALEPLGSVQWVVSVFFSTFCKMVPLFFMISGALLLGKDEPVSKTLRRAVKILIDLVLFSAFYYWLDSRAAGTAFSVKDTLWNMLHVSHWPFWYLYAYIGFILTVPILRKFVISLDRKTSIYLLVLVTCLHVLAIIEYFWTGAINVEMKPVWLTADIFIYPVTGYIIENKIEITKRTVCRLWGLVCLCFVVSSISEYFYLQNEPGNYINETFIQMFMLINNLTVYITIKYIFENVRFSGIAYRVLTEIGACTYGIYLTHVYFLNVWPAAVNVWTKIEGTGYFGIFISCMGAFILAGMLIWLLRRIPIIRKLF